MAPTWAGPGLFLIRIKCTKTLKYFWLIITIYISSNFWNFSRFWWSSSRHNWWNHRIAWRHQWPSLKAKFFLLYDLACYYKLQLSYSLCNWKTSYWKSISNSLFHQKKIFCNLILNILTYIKGETHFLKVQQVLAAQTREIDIKKPLTNPIRIWGKLSSSKVIFGKAIVILTFEFWAENVWAEGVDFYQTMNNKFFTILE